MSMLFIISTLNGFRKLNTPASFTSGTPTTSTVALSWDDVSNEGGYKIEISSDNFANIEQTITVGSGVTSTTATGLNSSTLYKARLKATGDNINYVDSEFTTLSFTTSTSGTYEPEAEAFFDAVEAVVGSVAITTLQKQRYNDWVSAKKLDGSYSNYLAVFPCFGGIEAAHKINAIDLSTGTFHGTWVHSTSGCKPNGTNAWFDTGINPKTAMGSGAIFQMGFYSRTDVAQNEFDLGAATSGKQTMLLCGSAASGPIGRIGSDSIQAYQPSFDHSLGYHVARRSSNTNLAIARNGVVITTTTTTNSSDLPNVNIYAGAYNNNGTPTGYSTRQWCWIDILGGAEDDSGLFNSNVLVEGIQDSFIRGVQ